MYISVSDWCGDDHLDISFDVTAEELRDVWVRATIVGLASNVKGSAPLEENPFEEEE